MNYEKINVLGMELMKAKHKNVILILAEFPDAVSIYSIESKNPNKGEAQEAIKLLKQKYGKVYASAPLNSKIKHIFLKHGVVFEE